jgi:acyl-CoA thioesterase
MTTATTDSITDLWSAMEPRELGPNTFGLAVPTGWGQARGTFGGILLGGLLRAIERSEAESERQLRSITGEIAGPVVAGPCTISTAAVRRGHGVSTWSAQLEQGEGTLAVATVVLGRSRDIDRTWAPPAVVAPPWRDCPAAPVGLPFVPEFSQHFEYRPFGPLPFSGAAEPVSSGWIRPRFAARGIGAAELVAMCDAWWPAAFSIERGPRPIATVAFTMQSLLGGRVLPPETPLLHRARVIASAQGFFVEMRELWTESGELVALNQQTFVWIR